MSLMVTMGKELIRICPTNAKKIERSNNNGGTWYPRHTATSFTFRDLLVSGNELLAQTDKGLYYSNNNGTSWYKRG